VLGSTTTYRSAVGKQAIAEGSDYAIARGESSHAEGVASYAYGMATHVEGGTTGVNIKFSGSNGTYTAASTVDMKYLYSPIWSTSGVGYISAIDGNTITTTPSIGSLTSANVIIRGNTAIGNYAHAEGCNTVAKGIGSHSEGNNTIASGTGSHVEGDSIEAFGTSSHAEGTNFTESVTLTGSDTTYTLSTSNTIKPYYLHSLITYANKQARITAINYTNKTITVDKTIGDLSAKTATCNAGCAYGGYSHTEGAGVNTHGTSSHSEGQQTITQGNYSHAEGYITRTVGMCSHAEGSYTSTIGHYSHAEGGSQKYEQKQINLTGSDTTYTANSTLDAWIVGQIIEYNNISTTISSINLDNNIVYVSSTLGELNSASCTIWTSTNACGKYAHAEGNYTSAYGNASHAEGTYCTTLAYYSHAEGYRTIAFEQNSHAEGVQTKTKGSSSHAEGYETQTYGSASHAEGYETQTYGYYSHAEGSNSDARGNYAHAEGLYAIAYGQYTHAEGGYPVGSSPYVFTGSGTTYTASSSSNFLDYYLVGHKIALENDDSVQAVITAIDVTNRTITVSTSLGTLDSANCKVFNNTLAYGVYSHAEGRGTHTVGEAAHSEGASTVAKGATSHAEGYGTVSSADSSHAEGYTTKASAQGSHAEGLGTNANGTYSHAEGRSTIAKGEAAHAEGNFSIASGRYQHASGQYNVEDLTNTYAEIVGIGTTESSRKNGRTLDWSGNEQLAGSLTLGLGTTNQTTVTAAQLKQLIAMIGASDTFVVSSNGTSITSHKAEAILDAYYDGKYILIKKNNIIKGQLTGVEDGSTIYFTFRLFNDDSETYTSTSEGAYPTFIEPV